MNSLKRLWGNLQNSFWFVPSLIVAASIMLAVGLIDLDFSGSKTWVTRWPRVFGAGAAGARGMLSTIAGSMMTVVGVTFSMTLVTLALASSQYTSRILRNFMRDRVTQVVLGIFAGIFTYCLIVLRTIRGGDEGAFVPSLAVSIAVVLAIGGIGALIFFIHHIASSIQASTIIASVASETLCVMDRLFPEHLVQRREAVEPVSSPQPEPGQIWQAIPARENGYIQSVDNTALQCLSLKHKTIVRMERGIGEFVVRETLLASVAMATPPDKEMVAAIQHAYGLSRYRTPQQDIAFGIRQIVDMALRALSPSTNDTTTAVMCVDYLTAILAQLAPRTIPATHHYEQGILRVITIGPTFSGLVAEAFDQIRGSAAGNLVVLLQILDGLQTIADRTDDAERRHVLRDHVEYLAEAAQRTLACPHEQARFGQRLGQVRVMLKITQATTR